MSRIQSMILIETLQTADKTAAPAEDSKAAPAEAAAQPVSSLCCAVLRTANVFGVG